MRTMILAVLALSGAVGCSGGDLDAATNDSSRSLELLPTDTFAAFNDRPLAAAPAMRTLAIGSRINGSWGRTINSSSTKEGETVTVIVTSDVKDARGRVVIPSGATVDLLITDLEPATSRSDPDGKLALSVTSTTIRGKTYTLQGAVTSVPHTLKSHGIGTSEAKKVGIGTAVGAVVGQVIGKDTKATVIGGAVGAVAGAAVARETKNRDLVVTVGAPVVITLTGPFTIDVR
ncbi:MAG TPA: YMGG-like glycine zipper-containing protein [Gemmatimonadaceae bacterium]|nr:YMGG-like glycine zipper-containing protein [Gemmatimonadaceae bacterium]